MDHARRPRSRNTPHHWRMFWRWHICAGGRSAAAWRSGCSEVNPHLRILEVRPPMFTTSVHLEERGELRVVRLRSSDGTNRLTRDCVLSLTEMAEPVGTRATADHSCGQRPIFLCWSRTGRDLRSQWSLGLRVLEIRTDADECYRLLPCPCLRRHFRLLHGRRSRSRSGLPISHRLSTCGFRASRRGLGPDHWLGRHTALAATGRQRACPRNVGSGRKNHGHSGLTNRTHRYHCCRSGGRSGAMPRSADASIAFVIANSHRAALRAVARVVYRNQSAP